MCPCVHKRVLGGLPGARSQMTPGLLGSQLRPLWGHSHLKPHGFLWLFSSPIGAWDPRGPGPRDSGRRNWSPEERTQLPAHCLVSVHPVAAFCQVGSRSWGWGPTQVGGGLLWGICPSSLGALIRRLGPPVPRCCPRSTGSAWEAGPFLAGHQDLEAWFLPRFNLRCQQTQGLPGSLLVHTEGQELLDLGLGQGAPLRTLWLHS